MIVREDSHLFYFIYLDKIWSDKSNYIINIF
nr:MAG TPA: hypothetical protein [Crassvirales sp.]